MVGAGVAAVIGASTHGDTRVAVLAGAFVLGLGVVIVDPLLLAVFAVPGTLLVQRLGGGAAGSSIDLSDVILALGAAAAFPMVRWDRARALRPALAFALVYEAGLLLSVAANTNTHSVIEWGHRLVLVAGAMIAGWAVTVGGRARQALVLYLVGSTILALVTLEHSVTLHFKPAQWGLYQKNYIGAMMWMAVVIAHLAPRWADIPPRLGRVAKYLCLLALFASQSKQSIVALAVAVVIAAARQRSVRQRSKAILVALGPLVVFAYVVSSSELTSYNAHQYNSLKERSLSYASAFRIWRSDLWLGQGPRWFYLPKFAGLIQPPNIFLEALTESGIVGVVCLATLLVGVCWILVKLPREIGTLALVVVVGRAVEGIFDIYWISASGALPWLIVGLCLGAADRARQAVADPLPVGRTMRCA